MQYLQTFSKIWINAFNILVVHRDAFINNGDGDIVLKFKH